MILTTDFRQLLALPCNPLVLACGCFDLLTVGHVRHLKAAKQMGKSLCVLVTADRHVNKPGRPIVPESQRVEVVDALGCVDYTIMNPYPTAVEAIRSLRPQVYVKGKEYKRYTSFQLMDEIEALRSTGGKLEFTETEEAHTTDVIDLVRKAYESKHISYEAPTQHLGTPLPAPVGQWAFCTEQDECPLCARVKYERSHGRYGPAEKVLG